MEGFRRPAIALLIAAVVIGWAALSISGMVRFALLERDFWDDVTQPLTDDETFQPLIDEGIALQQEADQPDPDVLLFLELVRASQPLLSDILTGTIDEVFDVVEGHKPGPPAPPVPTEEEMFAVVDRLEERIASGELADHEAAQELARLPDGQRRRQLEEGARELRQEWQEAVRAPDSPFAQLFSEHRLTGMIQARRRAQLWFYGGLSALLAGTVLLLVVRKSDLRTGLVEVGVANLVYVGLAVVFGGLGLGALALSPAFAAGATEELIAEAGETVPLAMEEALATSIHAIRAAMVRLMRVPLIATGVALGAGIAALIASRFFPTSDAQLADRAPFA